MESDGESDVPKEVDADHDDDVVAAVSVHESYRRILVQEEMQRSRRKKSF